MNHENKDEENSLPKSTVDRFINSCLPKHVTVSKESKELFTNCLLEFLKIISLKSTKICEQEKRKTITFEHIIKGLNDLGFEKYTKICRDSQQDYEQYVKSKPSKINKFKDSGLSLEELHNQQLELFKNAKKEFEKAYIDDEYEENKD